MEKHLTLADLENDLLEAANPERAALMQRYFKTGPGQYAAGDRFIGLSNPTVQGICKQYNQLTLDDLEQLLGSPLHEFRFAALTILKKQFQKHKGHREAIFQLYLRNLLHINNWDLVDCSARDIVGAFLYDKDRTLLDEMAAVPHLWTQRVAIIATFYFIGKGEFADTLRLAGELKNHPHDLMHKAVGWMLREVWKRGGKDEVEDFLRLHIASLPRTLLRYAIEKMPPAQRREFMEMK